MLKKLIAITKWLLLIFAAYLVYHAVFPSIEPIAEMEMRAEVWCEKKLGIQPPKPRNALELTEFDDCVDAEVRLYAGSKFGSFISGIFGGLIILLFLLFWSIRFAWRFHKKQKQKRQNPYD